ncbi:hypothetical protein Poli38472_013794 [Pythium oligandrum]|uniref:Heme oxygenase n=1 Tax=Pythium oligandrum TaxID=41045 RepID=A0A8K1C2M5_PYTOL|nr:hypothetical protein Poli38472_013794 [Pythium oligandrum]|eukprot:TMW55032.1 hypothetical protein Poli38472_013794 [Pythium oligandrum]
MTTTTTPADDALPLTEAMRKATKGVHDVSDKLVNLKLLVALTNERLYGQALLLFYYIYVQIESSLQAKKDHVALKGLAEIFPEFKRADAIEADLKHYLGEDWDKKYKPTPAVIAYVERIKHAEKENPYLLLSYSYHMYAAILAGGQMIRKMVSKSFELPEGVGLSTFDYKTSRMVVRSALKDKINAVEVDDATKQLILQESVRVFQMNNQLVRSIEGAGRQLVLWVCKWLIALSMIYWTYMLFVKGTK